MTAARFLQIHTLHSYSAALLNRDDSGLAKRVKYGGAMRTRVSSQCLKRHWRKAEEDPHALLKIPGAEDAFRSREIVTLKVIEPLAESFKPATIAVLNDLFQTQVYGDKGTEKKSRQTLILGAPEVRWLAEQARTLAPQIEKALGDPPAAAEPDAATDKGKKGKKAAKSLPDAVEAITKPWQEGFKKNFEALRESTDVSAGLASALFGRMVTSDPAANIDAPIHVAHAFTVHEEETESDYFTAVDDLKRDEDDSGADTIQETELTSGLFYGYVVVDVPGLVSNLTGCERKDWLDAATDRAMAAAVVHNLIYLIAEVSPGAKLGSTAPYGRAELVLVEAGDRQPRSLSASFREPVAPSLPAAMAAAKAHLETMDRLYETGEARRSLHPMNEDVFLSAPRGSLRDIAEWAKAAVLAGEAKR
ncbi:MAG: type I-E CRISPR-associated protein Cas7/Cse4/CasC [Hyphomicrobiaceae bacterium]|nr:type I-E CRISPR-associated protein Cas7/Cse4/CasC [Hyphomicrobiaceae bacterium]